jgi:hypothetical protein
MGRWGDYKNQAPKGGSGGKYIKLADGDKVRFALTDTEPGQRIQHWLDGKVVPEGSKGALADTKIMLCVYDVDAKSMRVLSVTPNTFARLCDKAEKFGEDKSPNIYELERQKKNGKVQYELDRLDRMTPEQITARDREPVIDVFEEQGVEALPEAASVVLKPAAVPAGQPADADIPF